MRRGPYIVDVVIQPVAGRVRLVNGQQPVLVCQVDTLDEVFQRQLIASMAGRGEAEQLGRSDVGDRELILRVSGALLPVQSLSFVEKGMTQSRRVGIDARVTLLSGGKFHRQHFQES